MLDTVIYYATVPVRLFGRSRAFRWTLVAAIVLGTSFVAANWALNRFLPGDNDTARLLAKLPPPPPLKAANSDSVVIAPVAVSLTAIRDTLDAAAPRELTGKGNNPAGKMLANADVDVAASRGSMSVSGRPNVLTVTTPLTINVKVGGQMASQAGDAVNLLAGQLGGLINGSGGDQNLGQSLGKLTTQELNKRRTLRGNVKLRAEPKLLSNWRLQPNVTADVALSKGSVSIAGIDIDVAGEARPLIDQLVNDQLKSLQARVSNDPFIEKAAREQWGKMCRSIPLGGGKTGLPRLWLEMRPVRAVAAQPQVDARAVTLAVGIHAATRITASETKPTCPFPATIELVPPMRNGKLNVGLPIDFPFTMLNKLLEAQLKGHHYPEDRKGPVDVTVRNVHVAAAGDRLLIALKVHAVEKKSWFGFGANATVNVWGKPVLDSKTQILRFTDISLAVDLQAAYGLLSAAARAATPYLTKAIADSAVVDLKPFAADARKKIAETLAEFRNTQPGVRVDAAVDDVRLTGIAFDAHTLRVTAAAAGTVKAAVSKLPKI